MFRLRERARSESCLYCLVVDDALALVGTQGFLRVTAEAQGAGEILTT